MVRELDNDDLGASFNGSVYSADYEKLVRETRLFLIKQGINRGLNIIIDNVNASKRNWEDTYKIAKESGKEINLFEKVFYCELDELLERNAKRTGAARVTDEIVKKFFKRSWWETIKVLTKVKTKFLPKEIIVWMFLGHQWNKI